MQIAPDITVTADEAARLEKLNAARASVKAFVEQIMVAGERRNTEVMEQGQTLWAELGKTYGLDLEHVAYDYKDGKLVAVQARA